MKAIKTCIAQILLIVLSLLLFTSSAYAGSYNIISLLGVSGDCVTDLFLSINLAVLATTEDSIPGNDVFSHVLRDATGKPVGFGISAKDLDVPAYSGNGGIYIFWIPNAVPVMPLTVRTYDIVTYTIPDPVIADLEEGALLDTLEFDPTNYGVCSQFRSDSSEAPFSDGRLNNWDTGSPIVVFPHETETGRGLIVYSPGGVLLLLVRAEDIAAVAECPETNTLIASANNVSLYRLTDCSYQFNTPSLDGTKTYVLILFGLNSDSGYRSYEE